MRQGPTGSASFRTHRPPVPCALGSGDESDGSYEGGWYFGSDDSDDDENPFPRALLLVVRRPQPATLCAELDLKDFTDELADHEQTTPFSHLPNLMWLLMVERRVCVCGRDRRAAASPRSCMRVRGRWTSACSRSTPGRSGEKKTLPC